MLREKKRLKKSKPSIKVVKGLPDYSNDPFFVKKEEEAYRVFEETPLPEFLTQRAKESH
jgi:hypothetical protein